MIRSRAGRPTGRERAGVHAGRSRSFRRRASASRRRTGSGLAPVSCVECPGEIVPVLRFEQRIVRAGQERQRQVCKAASSPTPATMNAAAAIRPLRSHSEPARNVRRFRGRAAAGATDSPARPNAAGTRFADHSAGRVNSTIGQAARQARKKSFSCAGPRHSARMNSRRAGRKSTAAATGIAGRSGRRARADSDAARRCARPGTGTRPSRAAAFQIRTGENSASATRPAA